MFRLLVANQHQTVRTEHDFGPLEMGRGPARDGVKRIILVDEWLSRDQLRLEEQHDGCIVIENLSARVALEFSDGDQVEPVATLKRHPPLKFSVGETRIEIERSSEAAESKGGFHTISKPIRQPQPTVLGSLLQDAPDTETLLKWFETLVAVQTAAAGSDEFYLQTARAVVDLIGLDCGMVLLRENASWKVVATHAENKISDGSTYSRSIVNQVADQKRTFFRSIPPDAAAESLKAVDAVVASPILGGKQSEQVVGVVYGARFANSIGQKGDLRPLHAQLVQVLSAAVRAGMSRIQSEAEAARRRVQFEQFVSPAVARELDRDPDLLKGKNREISALFADIRNFSRISERVGPEQICSLVQAIMDRLATQVRDLDGTTVSYLGDGLLAMWNAPVEQADHAALACRAALAMIATLPELNEQWRDQIGETLAVGIGINTGPAMVGNTGSGFKPHYGPLGHAVNLASRVEGATKKLGVPVLITGATHAGLAGAFATRRLCRVRVLGINDPVDLYELHGESADDDWRRMCTLYESGLAMFESGQSGEACQAIYPILSDRDGNYDKPSLTLVSRAIEHLKFPDNPFDPVWDLQSK